MRIVILLAFSLASWIQRLGGMGLILLGIADNSAVPLPGSMDVFTIILASARREWWPYYGLMATLGAVAGGYITYRLAEKGGAETLEKKVGKERAEKVYKKFEQKGFTTVVIGAVLPPPFPIVPFLMAAGILQYPPKKFLAALGLGRGIRYFALAYVGHIYGKSIINFFSQVEQPMLYALLSLAALGGLGALIYFKYYRPKRRHQERQAGEPVEQLPIPGRGNQKLKEQQQGNLSEEEAAAGKSPTEKDEKEKRTA
jgi:membrane protein YqaA with SNARE-associated domain